MNNLKYITDLYKLPHTGGLPKEIPQAGRAELARLFAKLGFAKGAEVGVWQGDFSQVLCLANTDLSLFGIDLNGKTPKKAVPANCKLVRMNSMAAANKFVDASLDFVYLDSNHDFVNAVSDIAASAKKVRPGGIVAGHDYFRYRERAHNHTYEAITAYTGAYRITPWFVIGRAVDPVRSWFWVKA